MSWSDHELASSSSNAAEDEGENQSDERRDRNREIVPAEEVAVEALETVRSESRHVLTEQISLLNDIDDKAMRSVRTSVLFIGLIISAIQISGGLPPISDLGLWSFRFGATGVCLLLISMAVGVYTYSVSDPPFGVSSEHRNEIVAGGYSRREWLLFQLNEYDEWIDTASAVSNRNIAWLHATLFSLVSGVFFLLASVLLSARFDFSQIIFPVFFATGVSILVTIALHRLKR
jgi:hypothetical protein